MNRRQVSSYTRGDGTRVRGYSQRYEKGDLRAVTGGLGVAALALVVAGFHVAAMLLEVVAVVAVVAVGVLALVVGARRRRGRRGTRSVVSRVRRHYRAKRRPARSRDGRVPAGTRRRRVSGEGHAPWVDAPGGGDRAGTFVRQGDEWRRAE